VYAPGPFEETRPEVLHALIRDYPLATFFTDIEAGANQIPFLLDEQRGECGILRGHVARANPVWRSLQRKADTLLLFHGPVAYVSPSWYPSKQEHGKVVPTWNYATVHVRGRARVVEDADWLLQLVTDLTVKQESVQSAPWQVDDAPSGYTETLLKAIVGIEITVDQIQGKFKLSQNRPSADQQGVMSGLEAVGEPGAHDTARLMRQLSSADKSPD
jgi:transcriptional regulator